jgi:hypothetical protein
MAEMQKTGNSGFSTIGTGVLVAKMCEAGQM